MIIVVNIMGSYFPHYDEKRTTVYNEGEHIPPEKVHLPKKVDVFSFCTEDMREEPLYEVHEGGDIYLRDMERPEIIEEYCPRKYRSKVERVFVAQNCFEDGYNEKLLAAKVIFVTEN